jgi:acetyl-CoA carboxylase biotin carboxyl carrier protein
MMPSLSPEDIDDILRLLDSSAYDELHLETERFAITLRRHADGGWTQESKVQSEPHMLVRGQPAPDAGPTHTVDAPSIEPVPFDHDGLVEITAPLPGVFYRSPRPGAAPFVEVGDRVQPETVVAIIETMKLMNSVTAGIAGTIAEIAIGNGEIAAQGAVLMRVVRETP